MRVKALKKGYLENLRWEYEALEELKAHIYAGWKIDHDLFKQLSKVNENILRTMKAQNVQRGALYLNSKDENLVELFDAFFGEIVFVDPILQRIYIHNTTMPEALGI